MTSVATKRPTLLILAMLIVLSSVWNIGINLILLINPLLAFTSNVPKWAIYLNLVIGIVQLLILPLLLMYKRIGLIAGLTLFSVSLLVAIISIVMGQTFTSLLPIIVLSVIVLFFLFRYLTSKSQKSMFA